MSKKKDRAEELAEQYLQSLGYTPFFEPNKEGTFPDFKVTPDLAAEVRFLNEQYFSTGRTKGLREESQPLYDRVESVFRKFDSQYNGHTYFAGIRFSRPLQKGEHIKQSLKCILSSFLKDPKPYKPYEVANGLSISFFEGNPIAGKTFLFGTGSDSDAGGRVIPNFLKNLNHCIADKTSKQQPHRHQYQEWWLILVDQIVYGFSEQEKSLVLSAVEKPNNWDRIIVLSILTGKVILEF